MEKEMQMSFGQTRGRTISYALKKNYVPQIQWIKLYYFGYDTMNAENWAWNVVPRISTASVE